MSGKRVLALYGPCCLLAAVICRLYLAFLPGHGLRARAAAQSVVTSTCLPGGAIL